MKYLLDTNIIIYAIKGTYPAIPEHFRHVPAQTIAVPSVVVGEIEYGARKSISYEKTMAIYRAFINTFEVVSFNQSAAVRYGEIRNSLERAGTPIGGNDMQIAAIALAEGAILVTHNTKEFERIPGLQLQDWTE